MDSFGQRTQLINVLQIGRFVPYLYNVYIELRLIKLNNKTRKYNLPLLCESKNKNALKKLQKVFWLSVPGLGGTQMESRKSHFPKESVIY